MKTEIKILSFTISLFLILSQLCSCNRGEQFDTSSGIDGNKTSYTLTVWGSQEDQAMLEEMCTEYAKLNPQNEYKFLFGVQGEGDSADKVLNDVTSGPDVYSFPSDQLYRLYASGALARIGGDIEKNVRAINSESSIDACTVTVNGESRLYAYPSTADNCCFVYYDKSVFDSEDTLSSLDKMLDVAQKANKKIHFKLNDDGWYLSSFFFAVPTLKYEVVYNDNMSQQSVDINFDNSDGLNVMRSLRKYIGNDSLVVQSDDSKMTAALTADASGKREAAAVISGSWNSVIFKELLGDDFGVYKLPTVDIGGVQAQLSGFMGYKLIGVNGYSANKGEAHKLAQFLTNEENQLKRYRTRGFAPTNIKASGASEVKSDEVVTVISEQARFNRTQKSVPTDYWTPMASLITPLVNAKANGESISDEQMRGYLISLCTQIKK